MIAQGGGPVRVVRVGYGRGHDGRWLDPDAERVLARGIYRRMEETAPAPAAVIDLQSVARIIAAACERFGVTEAQMLDMKVRKTAVKHARAWAAQEMKSVLDLSEKAISKILKFKHKSCVVYWLSVPSERLVA